ncbi:MAG: GNAT family N-acetyltransferase [Ruminococcaceae bacterium]|nr:GNAT family N-acetyltransferase [Oscillospiraceae bacterium]
MFSCIMNSGDKMKIEVYKKLPQEAIDIRIKVFVDEQGFYDEIDETDNVATHLLLFLDDYAIGTCRVFESEKPNEFILGRLCILKEHRGNNFGSMILEKAESVVKAMGGKSLKLHSQLHAKSFYEKSGYTQLGELEYEQNQPHIWMVKEI